MVYDDKSIASVTAECNVWIPSSAQSRYLVKVTGTDGWPDATYATLAALRGSEAIEAGSTSLPYTRWTDGTLFTNFTGQVSPAFDFTLVDASGLSPCFPTSGPLRLLPQ
jgi:hypothetical protein